MALSSSALLPLATMMALSAPAAVALPTVMDVASRKAGISQDRLMFEALTNKALRDYLAEACEIGGEAVR